MRCYPLLLASNEVKGQKYTEIHKNTRSFTAHYAIHYDTLPKDWLEFACQFDPICLKVELLQAACRASSGGNLELKEHWIRLGSMSNAALR